MRNSRFLIIVYYAENGLLQSKLLLISSYIDYYMGDVWVSLTPGSQALVVRKREVVSQMDWKYGKYLL